MTTIAAISDASQSAVSTPKLVVDGVAKTFRAGGATVEALASVSMTVHSGELVCLLGASGCGKSTLLNIIAGLDRPTTGEVLVDGAVVIGPGADRGVVFQHYSLFPWLSVARNIGFGLELAKVPKAQRRERVQELLGIMHLGEYADRLPRELSGGMRQRVAIARALAPQPDVLLLDEPFAALDAQTRRRMQDFLLSVWKRTGCTIVMVTHDVEEAIYLAGRIYVMTPRPGRIAEVVDVPFGDRSTSVLRDPRFLDLRDELSDRIG
ncbi:MAG: ABC transporter ATP-binding protein [Ilumatobacteraceae bacterium]